MRDRHIACSWSQEIYDPGADTMADFNALLRVPLRDPTDSPV